MRAILLIILFASAPIAAAQSLLPQDKDVEILEESERNPFGRRGPDPAARVVVEDAETEESKLQTAYGRMEVSGFAEGEYGRSVLLGRQKIFPGDTLPPVLQNQQEVLQVEEIQPDRIVLIFLEKQARPTPRRITLRYNLNPTVRHLLGTQTPLNRSRSVDLHGQFPPNKPPDDENADEISESTSPEQRE